MFTLIDGNLPDSDTEAGKADTGVLPSAALGTGKNVQLRQQTPATARKCQGWAWEQAALLEGETVCQVRGPGDHGEVRDCSCVNPSSPVPG